MLGSALIEGAKEKDTSMDKAMARVVSGMRLFKMQDGKSTEARFEDLYFESHKNLADRRNQRGFVALAPTSASAKYQPVTSAG
jgi:hypothetical protein